MIFKRRKGFVQEFIFVMFAAAIAGLIFLIAFYSGQKVQTKEYTMVNISGSKEYVLSQIYEKAEKCWQENGYGSESLSQDCFLVSLKSDKGISKGELEGGSELEVGTKIKALDIKANREYDLKVIYNPYIGGIELREFVGIINGECEPDKENCRSPDCPCTTICFPAYDPDKIDEIGCVKPQFIHYKNNGELCDYEWECNESLVCTESTEPFDHTKACCPPDEVWNGTSCTIKCLGEECRENRECGKAYQCNTSKDLNCNPTIKGFKSYEKACCPEYWRWNGSVCLQAVCNDGVCEDIDCVFGCPECRGPESICIGDGYCTVSIGENCENSPSDCSCLGVCCLSDPSSDSRGCSNQTNISKGNECFCSNQCSKDPENLVCNPTHPDFTDYKKACCDPGHMWNGTSCERSNDVLIVALKENLKGVYSEDQIKKLEGKIEEFQEALGLDGLGSIFLYLDEDAVKDLAGKKVTSPSDWNNIDDVLNQLIPILRTKYLIIIGGYDRFPQAPVGSRQGSDDPYGDIDGDGNYKPDIAVGRFPDPNNGDLKVILNALDTSISLHKSGGLDLSKYNAPIMGCGGYDGRNWNSGKCFCKAAFSSSCQACGNCCGCISSNEMSGKNFVMILAHGPGPSSHDFYKGGCLSMNPSTIPGLDVSEATWMTMSCGGGHLKLKSSTSGSMAMTFLKHGGAVYFGSTDLNYGGLGGSCPVKGGDSCIGSLYAEVATRFKVGERIGDAYREGKNYYFTHYRCGAGQSYQYHINALYGDPTLKIKSMW